MIFTHQQPSWELYHQCFPKINKGEENGSAGNNAIWTMCSITNKNENENENENKNENKNENDIGFYTMYKFTKNKYVLFNFAIYEHYRGHGYSHLILDYIINTYVEKNNDIYLFVETSNKIAYNLYIKHGFKVVKDFVAPTGSITMKLIH